MKFIARVEQILGTNTNQVMIGRRDGELIFTDLPIPTYVEIEVDADGSAMLYRYRDDGTFCGDTWHEGLEDAQFQATYEYGIAPTAWRAMP